MNTPCRFDANQMGFSGTPIQQAQCLLRFVKRVGNVDDTPATLPPILTTLLSDPLNLGVTKSQLRSHLQKQGIAESTVGGSVTDRVCHADSDNPSAPLARYFMQPFALWRAWIKNVPTFIGSAQPGRRG